LFLRRPLFRASRARRDADQGSHSFWCRRGKKGCHEEAVLGTQNGWSVEANGVNHRDKIVDLLLGYRYVTGAIGQTRAALVDDNQSTETAETTKKGRGSGILPKHVEL